MHRPRPRGQAAVELLAVLPVVAIAAWLAWQMIVAGHVLGVAGAAARHGERAAEVGAPAAPAARAALPPGWARRARVTAGTDGLRVRLPLTGLPEPFTVEVGP
ncbi:MAG: pilus assembly protein [Thermoleophilia bacterium]